MKNKHFVIGSLLLSVSVSVFAYDDENEEDDNNINNRSLNKTCVLSANGNNNYDCKIFEKHSGNSTVKLDFSQLVAEQNYPEIILCHWKGRGRVRNRHNEGGGYSVSQVNGGKFRLYKQTEEAQPNIIGVSFAGVLVKNISISCSKI